ncbi:MAG: lipopolysaccharide assembly protein LapA domain-containing protein [Spirochaetales bacterium]|nr:lipopolysaccharide assembly protein LapA domain-containing protein [Spirochaetales bacterium]
MVQIIFNIIFLLILTSIIILNVGNKTTINLFFQEFPDISVVVVVFLSFILGVLYAFCYAVYWKIRRKFRGKTPKETGKKGPGDDEPLPRLPEEPPAPPYI